MAGFTPLTFTQIRQLLATTYAAQATVPANDAPGSTLGSMWNAESLAFLLAQAAAIRAQTIARLANCVGADVDSFVAPFGVTRLAATFASGGVLCTTASPVSSQLVVPVGGIVNAANGLLFTIVADTTNPAYSQSAGGYVIAPGGSTVTVTVQCNTAGTVGNVQANQIIAVYGGSASVAMPAVTVTNPSAFTNAINNESDAALKARFTLRLSSGVVATDNALASAVTGTQAGLTYSIGDQLLAQVPSPLAPLLGQSLAGSLAATTYYVKTTYTGSSGETLASVESSYSVAVNNVLVVQSPAVMPGATGYNVYVSTATGTETKQNASPVAIGTAWTEPTTGLISGAALPSSNTTVGPITAPSYVTIPVNVLGQGTGPSTTLVNLVQSNVNAVRSAGITVFVIAPTLVTVAVSATLVYTPAIVAAGTQAGVKSAVMTAVQNFINGIGLDPAGATTYCGFIDVGMAIRNVPGVLRVDNLQINSGTADVSAGFAKQLVAGTVTLS